MSNEEDNFFCPLMDEVIEYIVCFDIHMVVERLAPKWTAPEKIYKIEDYENICLNCKNHRFD
ncbi:MAG: hypothetical protein R3Y29_06610 [bacterium]